MNPPQNLEQKAREALTHAWNIAREKNIGYDEALMPEIIEALQEARDEALEDASNICYDFNQDTKNYGAWICCEKIRALKGKR